jgi:hypothetical protein
MKLSSIALALAAALTLPQPALVLAADTPAAASQPQTQPEVTRGYLGVTIDRLPDSIRAQLPTTIPQDQGILVEQVMIGSPAEKAGLQPYDILLSFNDQKLFSPEQLTKLVSSDTSGQPVTLTIVRGGNISTLAVTLGQSSSPESIFQRSRAEPPRFPGYHRHPLPPHGQQSLQASEENWESFVSLSLDKLKDNQYKAVISYRNSDGTEKRLEFQGNRDAIRQQILAQKDLPDTERDQLLDALTSRDDLFPSAFGPFPPFGAFQRSFGAPPPWWDWHPDF